MIMLYQLTNANTKKFIINSFANGDMDRVKELHAKHGKEVFEFAARGAERAIFYSFKNCHFDVMSYYISFDYAKPLSGQEMSQVGVHISGNTRFVKFLDGYQNTPGIERFVDLEYIKPVLIRRFVGDRNDNMIDFFISRFPESLNEFIKQCGNSPKGKQLKRELQLKELFK